MYSLYSWQFSAARAACRATIEELATSADVGVATIRRIEAVDGALELRDDPRNRIAGGFDAEVVGRIVADLKRRGYELRPDAGGWPASVCFVGKR